MTATRKPRILWASAYCLLDTSSGASISIYQMLQQLKISGYEIAIVGATIFDAEKGALKVKPILEKLQENPDKIVKLDDGLFTHHLAVTHKLDRSEMTHAEIGKWYSVYLSVLEVFKPDLVFFYGGTATDFIIPEEARARGIPAVAYLVNENYSGARWCRDVDCMITDTHATAEKYRKQEGYNIIPVGKFIDRERVVAPSNSRKNILFINPSPQKGVGIVVQIAMLLESIRPDIQIEVVESRGDWHDAVRNVTEASGSVRNTLTNVLLTPNTSDMRPIYGRARLLLAPSLWWESGARVLAEAMLNGIPAIVSAYGGNQEMIRDGGIHIKLPEACHAKPYNEIPNLELLAPLIAKIIQLYDDETVYQAYVDKAYKVGNQLHDINVSTQRLLAAFNPLLERAAGNLDAYALMTKMHKQGVSFYPQPPTQEVELDALHIPLLDQEKAIFIDCGGYDGCSAVKFMLHNPAFDCITFEPNPALWSSYATVPTTLIKKAAYTYNGTISFTLDETDADGSSIIDSKKIDWHGKVANEACPKIEVECIDLPSLIKTLSQRYQKIVLKLDIEGAEYDILEKMVAENLIPSVHKIYAEFHWHKCDFPKARHDSLLAQLSAQTTVEDWDALDMAVLQKSAEAKTARDQLVISTLGDVSRYQSVDIEKV